MEDCRVEKRHNRVFALGVFLLIVLTVFFAFISKVVFLPFFDEPAVFIYPQLTLVYGILFVAAFFVYTGGYVLFVLIIVLLTSKNVSFRKKYIILAIVGYIISLFYGIYNGILNILD